MRGLPGAAGHRALPHTADVRVEAWGPTREECVAQAVLGAVACFADTSGAAAEEVATVRVPAADDEGLLVAALDELVYALDTTGRVPLSVEVAVVDAVAELRFGMVATDRLTQVGAVPKAVSLHELRIGQEPGGWTCTVMLDV